MSTLSSASTLAQIVAAYADNASYEEDASTSKAAAFITACRLLLLKIPKKVKQAAGTEMEIDPAVIRSELSQAQTWQRAQTAGDDAGGVTHHTFENFRD